MPMADYVKAQLKTKPCFNCQEIVIVSKRSQNFEGSYFYIRLRRKAVVSCSRNYSGKTVSVMKDSYIHNCFKNKHYVTNLNANNKIKNNVTSLEN